MAEDVLRPVVVVLNGTSSVGKSSIAKALQRLARRPLLHVQMDSFLEMMPPRYANDPEAFHFIPVEAAPEPETAVITGPFGAALMRGMRRSVAALAGEGLSIVVDDVMLEPSDADEYRALLPDANLRFACVTCELSTAERREQARGDRLVGLARWQYGGVHNGIDYDLVIDTTDITPDAAALILRDAFSL